MIPEIYAVDFDGTLTFEELKTYSNAEILRQRPRIEVIEKVTELFNKNHKIIIHTSRPSWQEEFITEWLKKHNVPFTHLVTGKLYATKYIDDKAIHPCDISRL